MYRRVGTWCHTQLVWGTCRQAGSAHSGTGFTPIIQSERDGTLSDAHRETLLDELLVGDPPALSSTKW
jgi:hypothetical protein